MAHSTPQAKSQLTHYRTATVNGRKVFYREAGDPSSPTIVLLHGLPTSSQMFRELIPALADQFHLIAPDYIGFGHSDAPSRSDFEYTFDNLAAHVRGPLYVGHSSKLWTWHAASNCAVGRLPCACSSR